MLLQLGQRRSSEGLVELLLECHGRIRRFLGFARRLATTDGIGAEEARTVAGEIRRYFVVAFPMHLADEDEDLTPRLRGTTRDLDAALARMSEDHVSHASLVGELIELCGVIERDPPQRAALASRLAHAAHALEAALEPHLVLEERVIFPALAGLPPHDQEAIQLAIRARRERAMRGDE
jgi:iron-sulfur cluster repair protein YtfE (RIC family)